MTQPAAPVSYDEMPYPHESFAQSHPDRLATVARLFGKLTPDLDSCRVLELGCASGDNLIPMAAALPHARFLGIDASARQIEQALQTVAALQLTNIELRHADIADVDSTWGRFDYIVCHGTFSWVPKPIQEKILAICRENLAPDGVAYVSYNTYPGWRVRGMIRDMMVYHSQRFEGAANRVLQARAWLDFLVQSAPAKTPYGMILRQELDEIRNKPDSYLFHEHLEDVNEPVYFHEFIEAAERHGMQYLGEAEFATMMLSSLPPEVAQTLRGIAWNVTSLEQYMDFVRNRTFRQTLLVHQGAPLSRTLDVQTLKGLRVSSLAQPVSKNPSLAQGAPQSFRTEGGAALNTANAVTKAAMLLLAQRPLGMLFEELVTAARMTLDGVTVSIDPATAARDTQILGSDLLQSYAGGVVELRVGAYRGCPAPSERPRASPYARLQAQNNERVTNLQHDNILLHGFSREILLLLDGTRDRDALAAALAQRAREGAFQVQQAGKPVAADALEQTLRQSLDAGLARIANLALLVE